MASDRLSSVRKIYDERSEGYDDSFHPQLAQDMVELAQLKPGQHVLDLACGTGLVALLEKAAVGPTGRVVGVDISEGMMDVGKRKAKQAGLDITWLSEDVADLSGIDLGTNNGRGFDLITCCSALVLLPEPRAIVEHWATFLALGGKMVVDVPFPDFPVSITTIEEVARELCGPDILPYDRTWITSEDSPRALFTAAGFEVERVLTTRSYQTDDFSLDDAVPSFEKTSVGPFFRRLREPDLLEKARALFVQKWRAHAGPTGTVRSEVRLYITIAKKTG